MTNAPTLCLDCDTAPAVPRRYGLCAPCDEASRTDPRPCSDCGGEVIWDHIGPVCYTCRARKQQRCTHCRTDGAEPRYDRRGIYYSRLCAGCWRATRFHPEY